MFIIGITGGSGTGKSSARRALRALGALTLDCDAMYHSLLIHDAELKAELASRFTDISQGGIIDRKRLAVIVFNDPSALLELNAISHKYVRLEIEREIANWDAQGGKVAAIDAIALIESGMDEKCDIVVGVSAPLELRISRIMKRDRITRKQAEMRINAQQQASFYEENCDYMLEGNYKKTAIFENKCYDFFDAILREKNVLS